MLECVEEIGWTGVDWFNLAELRAWRSGGLL